MLKMNIYIYIYIYIYIMKMRTNILLKKNNVRKARFMRFIQFNNMKQEKEITLKVTWHHVDCISHDVVFYYIQPPFYCPLSPWSPTWQHANCDDWPSFFRPDMRINFDIFSSLVSIGWMQLLPGCTVATCLYLALPTSLHNLHLLISSLIIILY
jgi:hypothetical protein